MKKDVLQEDVNQILSQAFWGKGGVNLSKLTEDVSNQAQNVEQQDDGGYDQEQLQEAHVCPLCESHLEEDISDDVLAEHVNFMVDIISEIGDISDDDIQAIEEAIDEELYGDDEDDDSEDVEDDSEYEDDAEVVQEAKGKMKGLKQGKMPKAGSSVRGPKMGG